jgi:hypothetical protein
MCFTAVLSDDIVFCILVTRYVYERTSMRSLLDRPPYLCLLEPLCLPLWHLCLHLVNSHHEYRPEADVFIQFLSVLVSLNLSDGIVTCFLGNQPIQRFVARQQLCKYATILQALLGSLSRCNNRNIVGRRFRCCPCRGYITPFASCQSHLSDSTVTGSPERDTVEYSSVPGVD